MPIKTQVLSEQDIAGFVDELAILPFFPQEPSARVALMKLVDRMVSTKDQLDWLERTMVDRVGKWHGPTELRGVFCTRFDPKDGVQAWCKETPQFTSSALEEAYIQREREEQTQRASQYALAAGLEPKLLTGEVEQDREIVDLIPAIAAAMAFPEPRDGGPITLEQMIDARLDYLKNRKKYDAQFKQSAEAELEAAATRRIETDAKLAQMGGGR